MRYFSLEEANMVLESIKPLIQDFIEKREYMIQYIEDLNATNDELERLYIKSMLEELQNKTNNILHKMTSSGCVIKSLNPLLLDFLSKKNDEDIWLCWLEGEDSIMHWHGLTEGFLGRKPVDILLRQNEQ